MGFGLCRALAFGLVKGQATNRGTPTTLNRKLEPKAKVKHERHRNIPIPAAMKLAHPALELGLRV